MRALLILPLVSMFACDGATSDESDDGCLATLPAVGVTVSDPDGEPVLGATVEWDSVACPEAGDGLYQCTPVVGGANQLYVFAMNMRSYSAFETVPEASCMPAPIAIDVELQTGIAR
ncbi:MAG: hypothetical protein ABMA64_23490 [Myxococcota bacterium]